MVFTTRIFTVAFAIVLLLRSLVTQLIERAIYRFARGKPVRWESLPWSLQRISTVAFTKRNFTMIFADRIFPDAFPIDLLIKILTTQLMER